MAIYAFKGSRRAPSASVAVARSHLGMVAGRICLLLQLPPRAFHERRGGVVLFLRNRTHHRPPYLEFLSDAALLPQDLKFVGVVSQPITAHASSEITSPSCAQPS